MRGLGDAIKAATDAVGIKQCGGCAKRQEWLNDAVPFNHGSVSNQIEKGKPMKDNAICLHAYHLQHMPEILGYIENVNIDYDLIVTTTPNRINEINKMERLKALNPTVVVVENRGRDILPFLRVLPHLSQYKAVCKIHTKRDEAWRGPSQHLHDLSWREHMLRSLLADAWTCVNQLDGFFCQPDMLANYTIRSMYRTETHKSTLYHICRIAKFYQVNLRVVPFPVGTFFWINPRNLQWLLKDGYDALFGREMGKHGGEMENAFEVVLTQLARNPSAIHPQFAEGVDAYLANDSRRARQLWLSADDEYSREWADGVKDLLEHREDICRSCANLMDGKCALTDAAFPELTKKGGRGCPIDSWRR